MTRAGTYPGLAGGCQDGPAGSSLPLCCTSWEIAQGVRQHTGSGGGELGPGLHPPRVRLGQVM